MGVGSHKLKRGKSRSFIGRKKGRKAIRKSFKEIQDTPRSLVVTNALKVGEASLHTGEQGTKFLGSHHCQA